MHPTLRSRPPTGRRTDRRIDREAVAYGVAVVVLVTSGALLKSLVLNWIVGPGLVVVVVVGVLAVFRRLDGDGEP